MERSGGAEGAACRSCTRAMTMGERGVPSGRWYQTVRLTIISATRTGSSRFASRISSSIAGVIERGFQCCMSRLSCAIIGCNAAPHSSCGTPRPSASARWHGGIVRHATRWHCTATRARVAISFGSYSADSSYLFTGRKIQLTE